MKNYGLTSVHEFLGDRIVYRNLVPLDPNLPPLAEVRPRLGLPEGLVPRKTAPDYARVIVHLLQMARVVDVPGASIERLAYVGDTHMNDGTAFVNVCQAGNWRGLAFIGADRDAPLKVELVEQGGEIVYLANRWQALSAFDDYCREQGFAFDERTAVIVDLDKTALGGRGRNDHVIDRARVEAVRRTVGDLLGEAFDPEAFRKAYDVLNRQEFHPFTADNQDYLAYICLVLGSGLYALDPLVADVRAGRIGAFDAFITEVDGQAGQLPSSLRRIHEDVYQRVQEGDPTPFKEFRYNEFLTTAQAMGCHDDDAPVDALLADEIVVTQEVREMALSWQGQGALLFGLSDKPDEASIPRPELAAQGMEPIHRIRTHAIGVDPDV